MSGHWSKRPHGVAGMKIRLKIFLFHGLCKRNLRVCSSPIPSAAATAKHPARLTDPMDKGSSDKSTASNEHPNDGRPEQTYQRYYHLYRQGELERDVYAAGGIVCESGYEKDNWWAVVGHKMVQG